MINKFITFIACIMVSIGYMIFGTSFFFTSNLLKTTAVIDVLALRFLISYSFFMILRGLKIIKVDFKKKNLFWIFLTAFFEPVLYFLFETVGIKHTTTMVAGMIIAFTPVLVVFLESVILKEKSTLIQKMFLLLSVIGVIIVTALSSSDGNNEIIGIICMFSSAICGALFIVGSRKSSANFSAIEVTYFSSFIGAVFFNSVSVVKHIASGTITQYFVPLLNIQNLIGLLVLAILGSFAAVSMINFGISKLQASAVSTFSGITTITTIFVGIVFNNEILMSYHIIGSVLILSGVIGINYTRVKDAEINLEQSQN